jgi:magnesium-protoporphyrin O-methyltransferase
LLAAAADSCRSRLAYSHPPRNLLSRALLAVDNTMYAVRGLTFRTFAHPPEEMLAAVTAHGLRSIVSDRVGVWQVQGLAR